MIVNIKSYLEKNNIEVRIEGKNTHKNWVNINCPFCSDTTFHGGFNILKFYYSCWRCGYIYIYDVLEEILKKKRYLIKQELKEFEDNVDFFEEETIKKPPHILIPGSDKYEKYHKKYLERRGFNIDTLISKYDIRFTNHEDIRYPYRVVFPIFFNREIISYQCRDVTDLQIERYKACKKEDELICHKNILFNLDNCKKDSVVIVEGIFDVLKIGDNSCCLFGIQFTHSQIRVLYERFKRVYILFDTEEDEQKQKIVNNKARELAFKLNSLNVDTYIINTDKKDAGEMTEDEIKELKINLNIL